MRWIFWILWISLSVKLALSAPVPVSPLPEQLPFILKHNQSIRKNLRWADTVQPARPYAEYEKAGFLLFSSDTPFESDEIKRQLLKNLPDETLAVILASSTDDVERTKAVYKDLGETRLQVVAVPGGAGFWARDSLPVPVFMNPEATKWGAVDAKYYHHSEPDTFLSQYFKIALMKNPYFFEGGNFIVNAKGDCVVVDNKQASTIPSNVFETTYGCKTLTRLPHIKGIGHADESVKFMSDTVVLTDSGAYRDTLMAKGFQVQLLPRPQEPMETYVNSLLVNGTVFVPVFGESTDVAALDVYRALGLKVVDINTQTLSNRGHGSIHCITMTYPANP